MNRWYVKFHGEEQEGTRVDATLRSYFPDYEYKGVFLDVGAFEPVTISNSYHFEKNGWDVHCFEANTKLIPGLKQERKNVYNYAVYDKDVESVSFNVVYTPGLHVNWSAAISSVELDPRYIRDHGHAVKGAEMI